ncbi:T9SS type A sorting domain-containing protein [Hymenobacter edaphi]|uniref:Uncharacterized protein n=1 Tax=Hymenobacter edaphi TaxID=2211146 RepID=A0A328BMN7_9BACT|nr:T9SS type A sorting domain-containing protein [Hymenobacter edaphi]RAK67945.1 hypothetical protein DLM85_07830 [Hymenobacter edaphi]
MHPNNYSSASGLSKKAWARLTTLAAAVLLAPAAWAQAPANDDCAGAVTLTPAFTCTTVAGTVASATQSQAPIACNGFTSSTARDVWYKFTATSAAHTITIGSAFDGVLEAFSGSCTTLASMGCADDNVSNSSESITLSGLTIGSTYYARYYAYGSAAPTNGAITACVTALAANDAEVQAIYALGKTPAGTPQTVQAVIRNAGSTPLSGVPVTLAVTGATTFNNSQLTGNIPVGGTATVTFTNYTIPAAATGTNTLTVSLLADDNLTNNTQTYSQLITTNSFSYVSNTATINANNSVGFGATATAAFVVRYNTTVARRLTSVVANIGDPASVGNTVYGVVVSSTGAVLGRSANYVVTTADVNQRRTFPLTTPVNVAVGDFFVGLVQTPSISTQYFPMSYVPQTPTRPGTFYTISPFSATTGGTLTDAASQGFGIFVVEATADVATGTSAALNRAISLYPNPSTNGVVTLDVRGANAQGGLQVQVTNTLGQTVYTNTQLRDNFENKLDLSHLSAGVYTLKVKVGNDYTIRQLSLTK